MKRWFWSQAKGKQRKGFGALAVVIFLATVFTMLTTVVGGDAINLLHNNFGNSLQKRANYCAYAALQTCLAEMDKQTQWDPVFHYITLWNPGVTLTDVPLPNDPDCRYTVRILNNSSGGGVVVDPDGTAVPVGLVYVKVEAQCNPSSSFGGRTYRKNVASLGFVGQVYWQHAVLGTDSVHILNNSLIDSFYSNNTIPYPGGKSAAATVGTNGILSSLELRTASNVQGRLRFGPGGNPVSAIQMDGDVTVTGDKIAATGLYRVPRFKPPYNPGTANCTTAAGNVILAAGETRSIVPGSYKSAVVPAGAHLRLTTKNYDDATNTPCTQYFFNDSVNVTGGTIDVVASDAPTNTSRVEVYIGESVSLLGGAVVNPWFNASDSRPSRLQFIFVGNGSPRSPQTMTLDGASKAWAQVCGPGLDLKILNGSELFGAIRCFKGTIANNSMVHWDRAIIADNRIRGNVAWTLKGLVQEGYEGEVDIAIDSGGGG